MAKSKPRKPKLSIVPEEGELLVTPPAEETPPTEEAPPANTMMNMILEFAGLTSHIHKAYGLRHADAINVIGMALNYNLARAQIRGPLNHTLPQEEVPNE